VRGREPASNRDDPDGRADRNDRADQDDRPSAPDERRSSHPRALWLRQLAQVRSMPVAWLPVVRSGISIAVPLGGGLAIGQPALGLLGSIGTIPVMMGDPGGPYRLRLPRVTFAVLTQAFGFLIGGIVRDQGWVTAAAVTAVGGFAVLISVIGATASRAMLFMTIFTIVSSGRMFPGPIWLVPAIVAIGGCFALTLTALESLWDRRTSQREPVANVYRAIARQLRVSDLRQKGEDARQELTQTLNSAYDGVFSLRISAGGRTFTTHRLAVALLEATPLIEATVALTYARRRVPRAAIDAVNQLADAILSGDTPEAPPRLDSPGMEPLESALQSASRALSDPSARQPQDLTQPPVPRRIQIMLTRVIAGSGTWLMAVRAMLCLAVAEVLTQVVTVNRSYWVALTVAVVIKPDFGSLFARAVQRTIGTAVGVALGAGIVATVPVGPFFLPFLAVFAALLRLSRGRNYALMSVFLSVMIVILVDSATHQGQSLVVARLIDTLLGCGIVLTLGYGLWPGTWRSHLPEQLAATIDSVHDYLTRALGRESVGAESVGAPSQRRHSYRSLADLRATLQQAMSEPPPISTRAATLWPATLALERVTDAITAAVNTLRHQNRAPPRDQVDGLAGDLTELAKAIGNSRPPQQSSAPEPDEALTPLAQEIDTAQTVFGDAIADLHRLQFRPQASRRSDS
jgi:uncharacterized membrane protein YccC